MANTFLRRGLKCMRYNGLRSENIRVTAIENTGISGLARTTRTDTRHFYLATKIEKILDCDFKHPTFSKESNRGSWTATREDYHHRVELHTRATTKPTPQTAVFNTFCKLSKCFRCWINVALSLTSTRQWKRNYKERGYLHPLKRLIAHSLCDIGHNSPA